MVLEVKNLTKSFHGQQVLKGIDLSVDAGDATVILGPSGAGKTTLLRCMNFLETADGGEITFDGKTRPIQAMTKKEREGHAKFIGLVEKREAVQSKMKLGLLDQGTLQELVETQMQMAPLAKEERDALARELARELGYTGGDAEAIRDAVANIFDVTASGFDGMMDASEGMPGVEIGTEVQVVPL